MRYDGHNGMRQNLHFSATALFHFGLLNVVCNNGCHHERVADQVETAGEQHECSMQYTLHPKGDAR